MKRVNLIKKYKSLTKKEKTKIKYIIAILLVIISASALAIILNLSTNHPVPLYFSSNEDTLNGIDVSHHNGNIEWDKVKENVDFAFIRVGYRGHETGTLNEDKNAHKNLSDANKCKLPVGVYVYSQAITEDEAIEEAKFALKMVKAHDISLPIIIDYEYPTNKSGAKIGRLTEANLNNEQRTSIINAFLNTIKKAGYDYGVYASANVYIRMLNADKFIDDTFIWVAQYDADLKYTKNVDIWQYSQTGKIDGIEKPVDLNYWYDESKYEVTKATQNKELNNVFDSTSNNKEKQP